MNIDANRIIFRTFEFTGCKPMYARMMSLITAPGKRQEICRTFEANISPLMKKQSGFVEHVTLISEQEPRLITVISFWRTKADAEHYRTTVFPTVLLHLQPLLATEPVLSAFQCDRELLAA